MAPPGAIVRIRLCNFMTYTDMTLLPGPNLNLILGPNGTGKSAIVCAIITGLAGEVSITGRATSMSQLVKRGTDSGFTEIELNNCNGRNYVIKRKTTLAAGGQEVRTEWRINDVVKNRSAVAELMKKLSIKVDNLCQFLPQDSVTNFVKMGRQDLLCSTLEASGDAHLVEQFRSLIVQTKDVSEKQRALDALKCKRDAIELNVDRLKDEVEKSRKRQEFIRLKNTCISKKYYVRYLEAQKKVDSNMREVEELTAYLKSFEAASKPYLRDIETYKREERRLTDSSGASEREIQQIRRQIEESTGKIDSRNIDCQGEFLKFRSKQESEATRRKTLLTLSTLIESLEKSLAEMQTIDYSIQLQQAKEERDEKKQMLLTLAHDRSNLEEIIRQHSSRVESLRYERDRVRAINERKRHLLEQRSQETSRGLEWLLRNESIFNQKIFHPVMCEINVKDVRHAPIIENAISQQELLAFVCQTEADLRLFTQRIFENLHTRLTVILAPENQMDDYNRQTKQDPNISYALSKGGVLLKDLIEAPDPVMRYLCGIHNFHRILYFDKSKCPESLITEFLNRVRLPKFYVGESLYSVQKSRYDGNYLTYTDSVREPRMLQLTLDKEALLNLDKEIKQCEESHAEKSREREASMRKDDLIKREWQIAVDKCKEFEHKSRERQRVEAMIKSKRDEYKKLEAEKVNLELEREKLKSSVTRINREMTNHLKKLEGYQLEYRRMLSFALQNRVLKIIARHNHKLARKKYSNSQKESARVTELLKRKELDLDGLRRACRSELRVAEERIEGFDNGQLDSRTKRKFDKVSENSIHDLELKIEDLTLRIRTICQDNDIIKQYNDFVKDLEDYNNRIRKLEEDIAFLDQNRAAIKDNWRHRVMEIIAVVNENYKEFMRKLHYDGIVKLDYDIRQPDNFAEYGVLILVKYRDNEDLIPLSSTRQSGGERSVATMIYMLALQTQTSVPFRCVDEINQGMDQENERKVFELLVKTADSSSSQYFLISPKLLNNLPYSEKMKIHIVFNGPGLHLDWNNVKF